MHRAVYSEHKRMYCITYESLTTLDGLNVAMFGPEAGLYHNLTLLRQSGLENELERFPTIGQNQYYVYGDSAYLLRPWMQRPFINAVSSEDERLFNKKMSAVRVAVEHKYKD